MDYKNCCNQLNLSLLHGILIILSENYELTSINHENFITAISPANFEHTERKYPFSAIFRICLQYPVSANSKIICHTVILKLSYTRYPCSEKYHTIASAITEISNGTFLFVNTLNAAIFLYSI